MGRHDPGLALFVDWAARKKEILEQAQAGWPNLGGNQVYLDFTIDGRREQTMRLVFGLFLEQVFLGCTHSCQTMPTVDALHRYRLQQLTSITCARIHTMGLARLAILSHTDALGSTV